MQDIATIAPGMQRMQDLLACSAADAPGDPAVFHPEVAWSYARLLDGARRYAAAFCELNLAPGERVALLVENSPDYIAAYFGIFFCGGVAVPCDVKGQPDTLAGILDECEVRILVVSMPQGRMALNVISQRSLPTCVVGPGLPDALIAKVAGIRVGDFAPQAIDVQVDPAGAAVINYTSGSSGKPKGVVMSHRAILANTRSIVASLGLTRTDRMMQILPFFYCYGASLLHTHFMVGGSLVLDNRFMYPAAVLNNLRDSECTGLAGVPSTFHTLAKVCPLKKSEQPSLRLVTQAGGRLEPELVELLRESVSPALFFVMYGQTEASARLTSLHPADWPERRGSVGRPIPGVELRIVDETGTDLPAERSGEIWARGPNLMSGYWRQPEESAAVLRDGWLRTGDIGRVDSDGFLYIEGRKKDIIKTSGYRVSPAEVEAVLKLHESVEQTVVLGLPDAAAGEKIAAVVAAGHPELVTERELINHCGRLLPPHKVPRRIVVVAELPKSAAGKVQRESLLKLFE
jgi:acyl-CoA synthetase (AMP-forming)/AMP-acid ligase II